MVDVKTLGNGSPAKVEVSNDTLIFEWYAFLIMLSDIGCDGIEKLKAENMQ